ncbi:hypothetical protein CO726_09775 [Bacillus fungorum]|uniref:Integrase catalytic domain-containing protein n=1 Tax=Bacillus fungorum TaxID=2039284 RepID=A0A2G6QFQ6_9BACI|nr:TnsA endonuclease N-terminal domain-containing protein [Bacillus fungorum]PIE95581.1 hypothetical protein CO726_09775 [Bacillus fungorum]
MMDEEQLIEWFKANSISSQAQELINEIRLSEPFRKVQGGRGNVSGSYPSRKMGFTVQFESHTVELPAIYEMEYDPSVLEYYDQPNQIYMEYKSKSGRKISHNYTPDFFVIKEQQVGWEEWKTEEELIKLSTKSPNRYVKDECNKWRCPPGESYAARFGLSFNVRSSKEINWVFQRNIKLIEEYLKNSYIGLISKEKIQVAKEQVKQNFGITFKELLENNTLFNSEHLHILIAEGILYVNLRQVNLIEQEKVHIFIDESMSRIYNEMFTEDQVKTKHTNSRSLGLTEGDKFWWDNRLYRIDNFGGFTISAVDEENRMVNITVENMRKLLEKKIVKLANIEELIIDNKLIECKRSILECASIADVEEAYKRYRIIMGEIDHDYSAKTIQRWEKAFEEGKKIYGNGFLGLISNKKNRGNRNKKIDLRVDELLEELITNYYLSYKQVNMRSVYNLLEDECRKLGLSCPSYVTFTKRIGKLPSITKENERKGKRSAYQVKHWYLEQHTPRHGDVPFEIAHIDHTELDIELVLANSNNKYTLRPYLTLLIDAYSRTILAHYLTFDFPSFRSNMMILRECVRKHNQLPRTLVVDGGKEFHSKYFDLLCAQFEITKKNRPPAQARFGSIIERLFGTTNTKFIHNLQGNTQLTKEVRRVTKSVNPKEHAIWTLPTLEKMFHKWIDYYQSQLHSSLNMTPQEQFEHGMSIGGSRKLNFIDYDESFILATLPSTPRGKGLVQVGRGIVFNNIWYWNDELRSCEREKIELKYDPFNVGILYAYVNNKWIKCISEYYYLLNGKTHKELQVITEEIRCKYKNKKSITVRDIASFMNNIEEHEKIIKQSMKDKENLRVEQIITSQTQQCRTDMTVQNEIDLGNIPNFEVYEK